MSGYYLLGKKLGHSCSPALHALLGNPDYSLTEIEDESDAEKFIRAGDYRGLNVTIPYKQLAFSCMDFLSDEARKTGVVNTVCRENGKLSGYNTDCAGLEKIIQDAGLDLSGKRIVILGEGATAKTAAYVAQKHGAHSVCFSSRKGQTPLSLAHTLHGQILINTTPVGMMPDNGEAPVQLKAFDGLEGVIDVVFNPLQTCLMEQARALGIPCAGGINMLCTQGARSEEIFQKTRFSPDFVHSVCRKITCMQSNLVLCGMPGAGKTTIGRLCARMLSRPFFDTDEAAEQISGLSPAQLILQRGEEAFRDIETEAVRLLSMKSGCVIALGGGAVMRQKNRQMLLQNGIVCQLQRPPALLCTAFRPLSDTPEKMQVLLQLRAPVYESFSHFTVLNDASPEQAAKKITEAFHAYFGD